MSTQVFYANTAQAVELEDVTFWNQAGTATDPDVSWITL